MINNLTDLSVQELIKLLGDREITSFELTKSYLDNIEAENPKINAFVYIDKDGALKTAKEADNLRRNGETLHPLSGIPIAIKDNIVVKNMPSSAASNILKGWISPYNASVITKIQNAKMPILGRTNMDEFACGSSGETSAYGPTLNPLDKTKVPGGSGSGSAASIAASMAPLALGSDTGGSIRQPASFTGTCGFKPTYGAVSRYGLIALASSLDQIGACAKDVAGTALLQNLLNGHCPKDSTSLNYNWENLDNLSLLNLKGLKIAVLDILSDFSDEIKNNFKKIIDILHSNGAEIINITPIYFKYAINAYYVIMPCEASSNLARYDGIRYGNRTQGNTLEKTISLTRAKGFGSEVKRRILLGTYALSAGYFDKYYASAQKVRTLIKKEFNEIFSKVDFIITPTAPTVAFDFNSKSTPYEMYLNDIATIPASLAGIPAISQPCGFNENGLPFGLQTIANHYKDKSVFEFAATLENLFKEMNLI